MLNEGAYLEYLPHPIIPYRHSRFINRTRPVDRRERDTALFRDPHARPQVLSRR